MSDYDKNFLKEKYKEIEEELSEPKVRKPNISRAKQLIDFNPSVNLETGLKKTIKYFSSK